MLTPSSFSKVAFYLHDNIPRLNNWITKSISEEIKDQINTLKTLFQNSQPWIQELSYEHTHPNPKD